MNFYDKRDDFHFYIGRMPCLCSNIPSKLFYSPFGAVSLRVAGTTGIYNKFRTCFKALLTELRIRAVILWI